LVAAGERSRDSYALRLMHSAFVSRIYERIWRPALVRMVSRLGYETEDAIVDRHVPRQPRRRILELCCGTARAGRRWVERGADVLGVDRSLEMLKEARRQCSDDRLVLLCGDAERELEQPDTFDAVLCFAALHLLGTPEAALRAGTTSLRPGGTFVGWALSTTGVLGRWRLPAGLLRRAGLRPFPPGGLRRALASVGLDIVETLGDGAVELVVARRRGV